MRNISISQGISQYNHKKVTENSHLSQPSPENKDCSIAVFQIKSLVNCEVFVYFS